MLATSWVLAGPAGAATYKVTNTNDSGAGSLRQALLNANASVGVKDTIRFALPGSAPFTIFPTSALPEITDPVNIDGTSQTGYAGSPLVQVDGAGFVVSAGNSRIVGLSITDATSGIVLKTTGTNTIASNWIGLDPNGGAAGNGTGVVVQAGSNNNLIGGSSAAAANVVSANAGGGIVIAGNTNRVYGNLVGTNPSGTAGRGNGGSGVVLQAGGSGNSVGGTTAGARNVVSANVANGVVLDGASGSVVLGNYIGTSSNGTQDLGNGNDGVSVSGGATGDTVGGPNAGARNVISGNGCTGVEITGSTSIRVQGNYIGVDASGFTALANGCDGVTLSGNATDNTIGGMYASYANVVSGNVSYGVRLTGSGTRRNDVQGNLIGTDASGAGALGNGSAHDGIAVSGGARNNNIGGARAGTGNVVSGNSSAGIHLWGSGTLNNTVGANDVGTTSNGSGALGNGTVGILVDGHASGNTIGGTVSTARNVVSANGTSGISIAGTGTANNVVLGNYVGTDATGSAALGNGGDGVELGDGATGTTVGGTTASARNVISANNVGVDLHGSSNAANRVLGNYVGLDVSGSAALGNDLGVSLSNGAHGNTIGGTTAGSGNVISANNRGMYLGGTGNLVAGNIVGLDATGTTFLANTDGIFAEGGNGNTIGGTTSSAANVIAGSGPGVTVNGATGDAIQHNSIYAVGGLGIVLTGGGNDSQPSPVVTSVTSDGTSTTVAGTVSAAASTSYTIELYVSDGCGEGKTFLDTTTVTTDGNGDGSFSVPVALQPSYLEITATATNQSTNDTSQFSSCSMTP